MVVLCGRKCCRLHRQRTRYLQALVDEYATNMKTESQFIREHKMKDQWSHIAAKQPITTASTTATPTTTERRMVPLRQGWKRTTHGRQKRERETKAKVQLSTAQDHGPACMEHLPPELLSTIFSHISHAYDLAVCMQVCRLWYHEARAKSLWANAFAVIRNEQFFKSSNDGLPGFVRFGEGGRAFGSNFVPRDLLPKLVEKQIQRVVLAGPNIHKDSIHMHSLARELPNLKEIVFHRCDMNRYALQAVNTLFGSLEAATFVGMDTHLLASLVALLQRLTSLTFVSSVVQSRHIFMLGRSMPHLKKLTLVGCKPLLPCDIARFGRDFPQLKLTVMRAEQVASLPYVSPTLVELSSRLVLVDSEQWPQLK